MIDETTVDKKKLFVLLVAQAQLEEGYSMKQVQLRAGKNVHLSGLNVKEKGSHFFLPWTPEDDQYLIKSLGYVSEQQMADHLGRTLLGVRLRWKRDLNLTAPSKDPNWIPGNKVSQMLGLDRHKIYYWCEVGLIPFRAMAGPSNFKLINRTSLYRWVVSPSNWIYFDWKNIVDPHLRRLCEIRAERWGDEWLTSAEVAKMHNVSPGDVLRLMYRKELPAVQVAVSRGGRNNNPSWLYWYVLRSDAVQARFIKGGGRKKFEFTIRALQWIKQAREMNIEWAAIARSMGSKTTGTTIKNAHRVFTEQKKEG